MRYARCAVVLVPAFVVSMLEENGAVVKASGSFAVAAQPLGAAPFRAPWAAAEQDPAAVEAALGLDRSARRLIQQGLRNEGFDPGASDGLFGPRTRSAIRRWQEARGAPVSGHLNGAEVELLRVAAELATAVSESPQPQLQAVSVPESGVSGALGGAAGGTFRDCAECPEMVVLSGSDVALGRYEVTVGEYRAFASATGVGAGGGCFTQGDGDSWRNPGFSQTDRHPVVCVSWEDAQAYVSWLSRRADARYRLLTELEWTRAVEGSKGGCYEQTEQLGTCPVGAYGLNGAGLSDMLGNVWEWTADCWEGDCSRRALRGGSWRSSGGGLGPGTRLRFDPGNRFADVGFRVSRTPPATSTPVLEASRPPRPAAGASETVSPPAPRAASAEQDNLSALRRVPVADPPAAPPAVSEAPRPPRQVPAATAEQENLFWQSIVDSPNPAEFEAYLSQFPTGVFRALAEARLSALRWVAGDVFRDCDVCPEMVVLPGGGLALGQYEVTVEEYRAFVSATGGTGSNGWRDHDGFPQTDRHPVVFVSWYDAQAYVSWLSRRTGALYRLPSEAEWERGSAGSQPGCYQERTGREGTCPVGSYGDNDVGLFDMVGNVWEWVRNCDGGDCARRVVRGGAWNDFAEDLRRSARDFWFGTAYRSVAIGFRVSRALD